MDDSAVVQRIRELAGDGVAASFDDLGTCISLSLADDSHLYHGVIRAHPPGVKQDVMGLICRLEGLRRLNLRRNKLGGLPPEFGRLSQLEQLVLGSNSLGTVPEALRGLTRLRSLHLGNNGLQILPEWMGELRELEYLALHKNIRLRDLAPLKGLDQLRNLNLFLLNLRTLPEVLYGFHRLETLTLWNVANYPAGLDHFRQLEFLTVGGCPHARTFPPGITALPRLRMARLHQNAFEWIRRKLVGLPCWSNFRCTRTTSGNFPPQWPGFPPCGSSTLDGTGYGACPDGFRKWTSWSGWDYSPIHWRTRQTLPGVQASQ